MQVRRKYICNILFFVSLNIVGFVTHWEYLIFLTSIIGLIFIIKKAIFSFYSLLSFVNVFTLFQEFLQEKVCNTTGMLISGIEAKNHFFELAVCTNVFLCIEMFFLYFTKAAENEKNFYRWELNIKKEWVYFFNFISVVFILLIFPTIPNFKVATENRFNSGFIPYSGFAGLILFLLAITYDGKKKRKWLFLCDVFVIFWFVGHGERVEILGLLVYMALKYLNNIQIKKITIFNLFKRFYKFIIMIVVILFFLVWLGITRTNGQSVNTITLGYLFTRLVVQSTACDVAYVFNCAVELMESDNLFFGYTYLSYLYELIPFASSDMGAGTYIQNYYFTVGGCPFFAEIMMNFGYYGLVPILTLFLGGMYAITRKINEYRVMFWIPVILEIFRIAWYGWPSWFVLSIYIVPVIYIFNKKFGLKSHKLN